MRNHIKNPAAVALSALGASKGGKARAASMSPEQRSDVARKAAKARWQKTSARESDETLVWSFNFNEDGLSATQKIVGAAFLDAAIAILEMPRSKKRTVRLKELIRIKEIMMPLIACRERCVVA